MAKKKSNDKKAKSLSRQLIRIGLITLLSFIFLLVVLGGVFFIYKDSISKQLLLSLNSEQKGKISFSDISFSPFIHFPSASIHLYDLVYLEAMNSDSIQNRDTIASMEDVYAAIHMSDLIKGRINIIKVTLNDGFLKLEQNPDSTINILNAIAAQQNEHNEQERNDNITPSDSTKLNIKLDEIVLKNIVCEFKNLTPSGFSQININEIKASVQFQNDILNIGLNSELKLNDFQLNNKIRLDNKILQINSNVIYDNQNELLQISNGKIKFSDLDFNVSGDIDLSEKQRIDLIIKGDLQDVQLFKLFLSDYGLQKLKSGESYFDGTIKGSYKNALPQMEFNFGLKNIHLDIPEVNNSISNLHIDGYFNSGTKLDLSQAKLEIKNMKGKLPEGHIDARCTVINFKTPIINLFCDAKTDVSGFDEIFKAGTMDSLHGDISIHYEFIGAFDPENRNFKVQKDKLIGSIDKLAFNIPGAFQVKKIDADIQMNMDTLVLSELNIHANNSDILINGEVYNLYYLLINEEKEIRADLNIKSEIFDFPALFAFDPKTSRSFPYRIVDMNIDLAANSTTSKLIEYESNPKIDFKISQMKASIEDLFPPITIHHGNVILTEKDNRLLLDFNDFDIETSQGNLHAHVEYFSPAFDPDKIEIDAEISDFNPGKFLLWPLDSVTSFADGKLSSIMHSDFEIGMDTFDFKTFNLSTDKLVYTLKEDTVEINKLQLNAENVFYSLIDQPNILEAFIADIKLRADQVGSRHFKFNELSYDIKARSGIINVIPGKNQIFGKGGDGNYTISIIDGAPSIKLKYSIGQFKIDDLLANMLSDTILTGKMDLEIDVILSEKDKGNIYSNMNGLVNLYGKDMVFHGLDIDDLIKKYNRSQKFNLVDLGAVILAGPVGLAVTKGSEYASLALSNKGESTPITNFISEWDIHNGRLMLKDVAFATEKNRIAGLGWIDFASDSLDVTIAILDKNGCSVLSQTIYGSLEDPQKSEIKIVSTVLAPVTNLIDGALGKDCEVVYDGKLAHPPKKTK